MTTATLNLCIAVDQPLKDWALDLGARIRSQLACEISFPLLPSAAVDTEAGALDLAAELAEADVVLACMSSDQHSARVAALASAAVALDLEVVRWELTPLDDLRMRCPLLSHPRVWRLVGMGPDSDRRLLGLLELARMRLAVRNGAATVRDWQALAGRLVLEPIATYAVVPEALVEV